MLGLFSHVRLFVALQTVAHQAPLSIGFSSQEYQSGLPCLPPGDLPNPGIEPMSLMSLALAGRFFTTGTTWKPPHTVLYCPILSYNQPHAKNIDSTQEILAKLFLLKS